MEVHFNSDLQARLTQRATQQGRNPDELVQEAVAQYFEEEDGGVRAVRPGSVVTEMRAIRAHIQADPDGWTTRDYVHHGRR